MAAFEVLALDTATPQIRAPGAGDTYTFPRAITPSGANVTPFTVSGYSLTGANAQSMFDLSGTWNTTGTPTALKLNITDTASNASSLLMDLQVGAASVVSITKVGQLRLPVGSNATPALRIGPTEGVYSASGSFVFQPNSNGSGSIAINQAFVALQPGMVFGWTSSNGNPLAGRDLEIARDTANTLAQRNGVNPQTFRLYNTYTDASNYERGKLEWSSNVLNIGTEKAGTGTARALALQTDGTTRLTIATDGKVGIGPNAPTQAFDVNGTSDTWSLTRTSGAANYSATSLGTSNTNSKFTVYAFSSGYSSTGQYQANSALIEVNSGDLYFNAASYIFYSGLVLFGGKTSSFPALKRNTTFLETKLADDSAYAPHAMQYLDITDGITAPASASGRARIYVDTADGDLKVVFGDGTVKTIVVDT